MAARPLRLPSASSPVVPAAALFGAVLVGALTAADVRLGIGLLMGLCYAPLVLINLPVGIALWLAVVFIEDLPAVSIGPNAAGVLIAIAWVGTLGSRREAISEVLREHRALIGAGAALLVWLSVSAAWARVPSLTGQDAWQWYIAALVLLVVSTTISSPGHVRLILIAFVAGAALSVAIGLVNGGLKSSASALDVATAREGRLQGGGGDPNYLAAGLVPAMVLAAALLGIARSAGLRWAMAVGIGLCGIGLAASESRGGLVAAIVAVAAALAFYKRRRASLALLAVMLVGASAWFITSPQAWQRISDFNGGGTGRTELWSVGWKIWKEHPFAGIGLNNFRAESYRYVRRPGKLEFVDLIAEHPRVVHNAYLQMLVELGVVGLVLFLAVLLACLRAAWLAARRFESIGEERLAELARGVLVASIGMLASSFFLSNGADKRLWVILALGPAMLAIANRFARRAAAAAAAERTPA